MADQGKWFKLWESALDDQELENLSIHEWYCWARLGTYLKKHGKDGELTIKSPAIALQNLLRLPHLDDIKIVIKHLPGYSIEESKSVTANVTNGNVTLKIKCSNWNRYQGDFSGDRVRKFRHRVTANVTRQEEKRRDVEEKRRDVSPQPPLASPVSTAKVNGMAAAGSPLSTLKINGKPWSPEPEIPDRERMSPEEMNRVKEEAFAKAAVQEVAQVQAQDDVF